MVVGCQPYAPAAFTPKKCSWYSFLLEDESIQGPWCDRKDFMSMKNPLTPAGIETATFRFAAQHLNHCATAVARLPPTLYNVFHPVFQFPLSVSFHHCSTLIHSSTTHAVQCFSPSTSVSPVSIIPPLLHTHSFIYHPRCMLFFSQYFSFPCQYHSTIAPHSFIHLPPTLYYVFLPVLQFPLSVSFHHCSTHIHSSTTHAVYCFSPSTSVSPVSIIPPLLHTHSFIYHPRCIKFFSQHFSFPLSVSFYHCSILIHSPTTHTV